MNFTGAGLRHAHRRAVAMVAMVLVIGATGCGARSGTGSISADGAESVRFGVFPVFVSLPAWVAAEKGFFKDEGLNVELKTITTGPAMTSAVASNSIDAMVIGATSVETARTSGMDLKMFAVTYPASIAYVMASDELLAECEDADGPYPEPIRCLDGKRVGIIGGVGTESYTVAMSVLNAAGLEEGDVSFVPTGGGEAGATFLKEGKIDVSFTEDTGAAATELMGAGASLADIKSEGVFADWIGSAAVATSANLEESPEKYEKLANALAEAVAWLGDPANQDEAAAIFKQHAPQVGDETIAAVIESTRTSWGSEADCQSVMNVVDWLVASGSIDEAKADESCRDLVASTAQVSE